MYYFFSKLCTHLQMFFPPNQYKKETKSRCTCTVLFLWGHNQKQDFTLNYHTTVYMVWLCLDYNNRNVNCKYCYQSA